MHITFLTVLALLLEAALGAPQSTSIKKAVIITTPPACSAASKFLGGVSLIFGPYCSSVLQTKTTKIVTATSTVSTSVTTTTTLVPVLQTEVTTTTETTTVTETSTAPTSTSYVTLPNTLVKRTIEARATAQLYTAAGCVGTSPTITVRQVIKAACSCLITRGPTKTATSTTTTTTRKTDTITETVTPPAGTTTLTVTNIVTSTSTIVSTPVATMSITCGQPGCSDGAKFEDYSLSSTTGLTQQACQALCASTSGCVDYQYGNFPNNPFYCHLFSISISDIFAPGSSQYCGSFAFYDVGCSI